MFLEGWRTRNQDDSVPALMAPTTPEPEVTEFVQLHDGVLILEKQLNAEIESKLQQGVDWSALVDAYGLEAVTKVAPAPPPPPKPTVAGCGVPERKRPNHKPHEWKAYSFDYQNCQRRLSRVYSSPGVFTGHQYTHYLCPGRIPPNKDRKKEIRYVITPG